LRNSLRRLLAEIDRAVKRAARFWCNPGQPTMPMGQFLYGRYRSPPHNPLSFPAVTIIFRSSQIRQEGSRSALIPCPDGRANRLQASFRTWFLHRFEIVKRMSKPAALHGNFRPMVVSFRKSKHFRRMLRGLRTFSPAHNGKGILWGILQLRSVSVEQ